MTTLLQINSSLFSSKGQSSRLADQFVAAWRTNRPDARVVVRDLAVDPVPHLDAARFQALITAPEQRTPEQQAIVAFSDALIDEIRQAELIVIGLPLYNFGVPSTIKSYFDHIARAGVTFRYTANGPAGLLGGKQVKIFAARGGKYAGTPQDTQTEYVRTFLALIGITDVEFVYAEGLNINEESKRDSLSRAQAAIERLAA